MIELGQIAREGPLRDLLEQEWLQAYNGVEGIALSYDERLVTEADRLTTIMLPDEWRGTIEYSRHVALLLAAVAERSEDRRPASVPIDSSEQRATPLAEWLYDWWLTILRRGGEAWRSPITVEISAGDSFAREIRPKLRMLRDQPYRYRITRSRGARLQTAAAGARLNARHTARPRSYGTLGGFLIDDFGGDMFGVTAAHVCEQTTGFARPVALPRAPGLVRDGARFILGIFNAGRHRTERCPWRWDSPADVVAPQSCTFQASPRTGGLDVALHRVEPQRALRRIEVADLSEISPVLELNFSGATSGFQRARATSLSIWHNYELNGANVCIHDCVQIKLAQRPYFRSDLSRGGDSGAWLLARGINGWHWVGLLTGGDGDFAGIVPARRIVERLQVDLNLHAQPFI